MLLCIDGPKTFKRDIFIPLINHYNRIGVFAILFDAEKDSFRFAFHLTRYPGVEGRIGRVPNFPVKASGWRALQ